MSHSQVSARRIVMASVGAFLALGLLPALLRALPPQRFRPDPFAEVALANVSAEIELLGSAEPKDRRAASLRIQSLPGSAYDIVVKALNDPATPPDASATLRRLEPVMKARARAVKRQRTDYDVDLESTLAAYRVSGGANPAWDADAEALMLITLKPEALRSGDETDQRISDLALRATKAGCKDPFVRCAGGEARVRLPLADRSTAMAERALDAQALFASNYPAYRRAIAMATWMVDDAIVYSTSTNDEFEALLPEAFAQAGSTSRGLALAMASVEALAPHRGDGSAFELVNKMYADARPASDSGPLTFKGVFYLRSTGVIEGGSYGNRRVQPAEYRRRVTVARDALTKAWELDPTEPGAAVQMLIANRVMDYSEEAGNLWFRRAVAADPDCYEAYLSRLFDYHPAWYGSDAEMVSFGNVCFETQNWRGLVPFLLADARASLADNSDDRAAYLARPEVWDDFKRCYEGFLLAYPNSPWHRTRLAKWACECGRWDDAIKLFEEIGDKPEYDAIGSKALFDYWKRKALSHAGRAASANGPRP